MLTMVEARSSQGALISFPLGDISSGIILEDVEGLDPVKATLVSSSFARQDGTQYHSSRREERNLKLKFTLEPDYAVDTVRDLRKRLYNFFMPKSPVDLKFYLADGLDVDISGRVEDFQTPMFTREPAAHIYITCFDPDFLDLVPVPVSGTTVADETEMLVPYLGTVETGIQFGLNVNRTLTEFTFYHRTPSGELRTMDFAAPLSAGDVLEISTVSGAKGATLTRLGTKNSILYGVSPQSNWIELENGDNYIRVYATGAPIPFEISYITRYGGL